MIILNNYHKEVADNESILNDIQSQYNIAVIIWLTAYFATQKCYGR